MKILLIISIFGILMIGLFYGDLLQGGQQSKEKDGKKELEMIKRGLFLERGVGIPGQFTLGWKVNDEDSSLRYLYRDLFGFSVIATNDTGRIRFLECGKPGCYTNNNVAVGELMETVLRRFGKPLQEEVLKSGDVFMEYDGVAFITGINNRVKKIYIIPHQLRKKK